MLWIMRSRPSAGKQKEYFNKIIVHHCFISGETNGQNHRTNK